MKVVFDFQHGVNVKIKNWEVDIPITEIPRKGDYLIAEGVLNENNNEFKNEEGSNRVLCEVENVDWFYSDGTLKFIKLNLIEIL